MRFSYNTKTKEGRLSEHLKDFPKWTMASEIEEALNAGKLEESAQAFEYYLDNEGNRHIASHKKFAITFDYIEQLNEAFSHMLDDIGDEFGVLGPEDVLIWRLKPSFYVNMSVGMDGEAQLPFKIVTRLSVAYNLERLLRNEN